MKLLMTTDTLGGVWTYSIELCAALKDHGVSVSLATMGRKLSPRQHREIDALPHVQLYESAYRLCWMEEAWVDVERAGEWLLSLEREISPDVVHLNDLAHGGLPWESPVLLVGHSCVLSWWEAVKKQPAPVERWNYYQTIVRASVQKADLVVAPSHTMLVSLLRHYGPAKTSLVIPNGRSFPPLMTSSAAKNESAKPFIFAAGRVWDDAKNLGMLTRIAGTVPWPIFIAGEQVDPNGGRKTVDGVHSLGFLDNQQMAEWLAKASIYVAPAHYEPFGLSILEAARAGCALVLGNIRSLREVWGDAADYVDPNDPVQLKLTITRLINDPELRQQQVERALEKARSYTRAEMGSDYVRCYRSLATGDNNFSASSIPTLLGVRL